MNIAKLPVLVAVAAATVLSACGKSEVPKVAGPPIEHGIFISTSDCADSGKLTADLCGQAIDAAVAIHEQTAPTYKSPSQCAAVEGAERCDKSVDGRYRARLQAFYITMSDPPQGVPLYPPSGRAIGFRSPSRQDVSAINESLTVSVDALTLANENAKLPTTAAAVNPDALGEAAGNIH